MKTLLTLIILAGLAWGAWMYFKPSDSMMQNNGQNATETSTAAAGMAVTANSSVDADLSSVDQGLSGVGQDSANIDAGLNDKPVQQTE